MPDWGEDSFPFIFVRLPMWEQFIMPLDRIAGIWSHIHRESSLIQNSQPSEVFLCKNQKPPGSVLLSLVAEIQEAAGLNFVFDRLNAFCFISKPNFIIVLQKICQV